MPCAAPACASLVVALLTSGSRPLRQPPPPPISRPRIKPYHNYAEMVHVIKAAQTAHPDIVKVFSIGKSYLGRDIWAVKVSDNVATDENEPEVMFDFAPPRPRAPLARAEPRDPRAG